MEAIQSRTTAQTAALSVMKTMKFEDLEDEIDIYSRFTLQELQDQRFEKELDLYICVIREGTKVFYFDASKFMENCIRDHGIIDNPFTRNRIEDFEIYVSTKAQSDFQLFMQKAEAMKHPNYYPVYWNDSNLSKADRLSLMMLYAKHFESTNLDKSLAVYKQAAERGSTAAKLRLATLYSERKERKLAVEWLNASILDPNTSTHNVYACARRLTQLHAPKLAFEAYRIMANRGNQYGLGGVIRFIEQGFGVERNPSETAKWRQKLPEGWRDQSITAFFSHLKSIQYGFDSIGYPL